MTPAPPVERHRYSRDCSCRACLETYLRITRSLYGEQDPLAAARGIWNALVISAAVGFVVVLFLLVNGWWRWWPA